MVIAGFMASRDEISLECTVRQMESPKTARSTLLQTRHKAAWLPGLTQLKIGFLHRQQRDRVLDSFASRSCEQHGQ